MAGEQDSEEPSAAFRNLASAVQIESLYFDEFAGKRDYDPHTPLAPQVTVESSISADYIRVTSPNTFDTRILFTVSILDPTGKAVMQFSARVTMNYRVPEDVIVEEASATAFVTQIGVFHAWPYCREFVQSSSARLGMPGIVIPPLRASTRLLKVPEEQPKP